MTESLDLSDLPVPHGYHDHDGEQVPFYYTSSRIQEPGKEPEDVPFGLLFVVCAFTPTPRVSPLADYKMVLGATQRLR